MTTINREAYQQLIDEDLEWLATTPASLERAHIEEVLRWSVAAIYDDPEFERKYRVHD